MQAEKTTPLAAYLKLIYLPTRPGTSARTIELYGGSIKAFKQHLDHEPTLSDLSDEVVGKFLEARVAQDLSLHTVNKDRAQLLAIWRHARLIGAVATGPTVKKLAAPRRIPKALTVDQLKKLQAAFGTLHGSTGGIPNSDFLRACFAIQFATAERVGAVLDLRFSDVTGNVIAFQAETRKGGRRAMVKQVPDWVLVDIERIKTPTRDRIFPIEKSNRTKIQTLYDRLFKRAGVERPKGKNSHLLRSTHATLIWLAGGNATKSLGHSSREVTKRHYLDPRFKPDDSCKHLPPLDD